MPLVDLMNLFSLKDGVFLSGGFLEHVPTIPWQLSTEDVQGNKS
jgi:hypothetical protein